jgi:hypothetical protein
MCHKRLALSSDVAECKPLPARGAAPGRRSTAPRRRGARNSTTCLGSSTRACQQLPASYSTATLNLKPPFVREMESCDVASTSHIWQALPRLRRCGQLAVGAPARLSPPPWHRAPRRGARRRLGPGDSARHVIDTYIEPSCLELNGVLRRAEHYLPHITRPCHQTQFEPSCLEFNGVLSYDVASNSNIRSNFGQALLSARFGVYTARGLGPVSFCSPTHRMPFNFLCRDEVKG